MARSRSRGPAPARPVRGKPQPRLIGFVGRRTISDYEAASLTYIGKCIAKLGHTLVIVPAKGAGAAVREGVELMGGMVRTVDAGVLQVADRSLLYVDPPLLERIKAANKDLADRDDVVIIEDHQLDEWVDAMKQILDDYGIPRP